jgi:hypothetical protein
MIDIKNKICEMDGCNTRASFNLNKEKKGKFCSNHKELNMIDVVNKTCKMTNCNKQAVYNIAGEKKGKFCNEHKEITMINVLAIICKMNKCNKQAVYNIAGEKNGYFCNKHKDTNMIDVKSTKCKENKCTTQANYGILGKYKSHCAEHKQKGMITSPTKKCETSKCNELGTYEADSRRFCENHKPDNAKNLGIYKCTSCGLEDIVVNGICSTCDPATVKIRQKAKEYRVKDVLHAAELPIIHNKMLENSECGTEKPDFQIDCGTHMLYIEVDENQHKSYACVCEQTRMINLVNVLGMPTTFIRYNPDKYKPVEGQEEVRAEQREKKLIEYIAFLMKQPPTTFANVLYLFYDEYNTQLEEWHTLI